MKKKKWQLKMTRRQVLKAGMIGGAGLMLPLRFLPAKAFADPIINGLHDPDWQTLFVDDVPDALSDGFKYSTFSEKGKNVYRVGAGVVENPLFSVGLVDSGGTSLNTPVWGYGQIDGDPWYSWPGRTFEVQAGKPTMVQWSNNLPVGQHLLPVDTSLHWAYSLHGYTEYSIGSNGTPIVMHLHGGHTIDRFDGNPEQFFSPGGPREMVKGPRFDNNKYLYQNDRPAGNLWYHDHALGITRLNVYAGLAGFYFVRDDNDTGRPGNPLNLPAWPYEKAYAIQDRMFRATGELFYPAYPGEPPYEGFITDEGVTLHGDPNKLYFPDNPRNWPTGNPSTAWDGGGPTALAEFFGDHMVVNGVVWPKEDVEPRNYRLHLLNGTDSRFMAIQFWEVPPGDVGEDDFGNTIQQLDFHVIGSDQGLVDDIKTVQTLLSEPGSRYDIIVDFSKVSFGNRVIMKNIGGDEPFGGDLVSDNPDLQIFDDTDKIMAFDVVLGFGALSDDDDVSPLLTDFSSFGPDVPTDPTWTRKVALFEGKDEFGRLQPLLGTAEPAVSFNGKPINWPNEPVYSDVGLTGPMEGSIAWHSPTTENPAIKSTEEWEIWNVTGDAHPVHLHLVHFEILGRKDIKWDKNTIGGDEPDRVIPNALHSEPSSEPEDQGTYLVTQPTVQHNSVAGDTSTYGIGFKIMTPEYYPDDAFPPTAPEAYVENAPKDMVTALPDQVTFIKARFDKPGRYVWHCHILSHEDHEMMRVLHVGGGDKDSHP